MARAVSSVLISLKSSFVTAGGHVDAATTPFEIDLAEFAERHGDTFASMRHALCAAHRLQVQLADTLRIKFLDEGDWLDMRTEDAFLTAVYGALRQADRALRLQVYPGARHSSSRHLMTHQADAPATDDSDDGDGGAKGVGSDADTGEGDDDAQEARRRVDRTYGLGFGGIADDSESSSISSRDDDGVWDSDGQELPASRDPPAGRRRKHRLSSREAQGLLDDIQRLSRQGLSSSPPSPSRVRVAEESKRPTDMSAGGVRSFSARRGRALTINAVPEDAPAGLDPDEVLTPKGADMEDSRSYGSIDDIDSPIDYSGVVEGEHVLVRFGVADATPESSPPRSSALRSPRFGSPGSSPHTRRGGDGMHGDRGRRDWGEMEPKTWSGCFTSISCARAPDGHGSRLWFVDARAGTLGVFDRSSRQTSVLLRDLLMPTHVQAVGSKVYFVERGGVWRHDGRLCCYDAVDGAVMVLLTGLDVPHGLFVTRTHDVYFIELESDVSTEPASIVSMVPGVDVHTAVAGANIHLNRKKKVVLRRSGRRGGQPQDLVVLPSGQLLLGFQSSGRPEVVATHAEEQSSALPEPEMGFLERYQPSAEDPFTFDGTHGVVVLRRIPVVKCLHLDPRNGSVYYAGSSMPPDGDPVAVARARSATPNDFATIRQGYATAVCTDVNGDVYYCMAREGDASSSELRFLRSSSHEVLQPAVDTTQVVQSASAKLLHERGLSPTRGLGSPGPMDEEQRRLYRRVSMQLSEDSVRLPATPSLGTMSPGTALLPKHKSFGGAGAPGGGPDPSKGLNVQVVLRCRPLLPHEKDEGAESVIQCRRNEVEVAKYASYVERKSFMFNRVYDENTSQRALYNDCMVPIVSHALDGYNCTVFAYGQTGTGKTYTLEGSMDDSGRAGVIPRCIHTVFEALQRTADEYTVTVSHLEIYNEELSDLLAPPRGRPRAQSRRTTSKSLYEAAKRRGIDMEYVGDGAAEAIGGEAAEVKLRIVKSEDAGIIVDGLEEVEVQTAEEIFVILSRSIARRVTHETMMNKASSRSHSIFTIAVSSTSTDMDGATVKKTGRLNLVDLSGSENLKRSGSTGVRKREASNINQGLLALGRVIKGIVEKNRHVPYRDSKLTRILEESLGGNSITLMVLTVSPNMRDVDETVSTLNYANMAKKIHNRPKKNLKQLRAGTGNRLHAVVEEPPTPATLAPDHVPVRPWAGAVPIRGSRTGQPVATFPKPRVFDATSAEWADKQLLSRAPIGVATRATRGLTPRAALVLQAYFAKFDADSDGVLTPSEIRQLLAELADVEEKTLHRFSDAGGEDSVANRDSRGISRAPGRPGTAIGVRGSARPRSAASQRPSSSASRSRSRPLSAMGGNTRREPARPRRTHVSLPSKTRLTVVRFLAFCAHKAANEPQFMSKVFDLGGITLNLEPRDETMSRALRQRSQSHGGGLDGPVQDTTEATVSSTLKATLFSRQRKRKGAALKEGADLCRAAAEEEVPAGDDAGNLLVWLGIRPTRDAGSRSGVESRASGHARPSSAKPGTTRPHSAMEPRHMSRRPGGAGAPPAPVGVPGRRQSASAAVDAVYAARGERPPRPTSAFPSQSRTRPSLRDDPGERSTYVPGDSGRRHEPRRRPQSALATGIPSDERDRYGGEHPSRRRPSSSSRESGDAASKRRGRPLRPQSAPRQMVRHSAPTKTVDW